MWKKDDDSAAQDTPTAEQEDAGEPEPGAASPEAATIGPSITIDGDVSGDEDLLIHGRVDGSVDLRQQSVTVGREGRVNADITGRVVIVEGEVEGDLEADEQIILRSAARVEGDLTSPRVVLEDGANFKGLVDMRNPSGESGREGRPSAGRSGSRTKAKKGHGQKGGQRGGSGPSQDDDEESPKEAGRAGETEEDSS